MKRANRLLLVMTAGILLTAWAGCSKLLDYVNEQEGGHQLSKYRIKTISGWGEYDSLKATFTYNQWGDPVKIMVDFPSTGRPHSFFSYDKKRRLTEFITTYDDQRYFDDWTKYYYNDQGQVVRDTSWYNGERQGSIPLQFLSKHVAHYNYDSYGRIIKVNYRVIYPIDYSFEYVYTYDSRGNRSWLSLPDTNDNKVNFLRTDPVWQLVEHDYSLNNPFIADAYNEVKLPVRFHIDGPSAHFRFLQTHFPASRVEITYEKK